MIFSTLEGMLWNAMSSYLCCDMTFKSRCKWSDSLFVVMGTDEHYNTEMCAYVLHLRQNKKAVVRIHKRLRKLAIRAISRENSRREEVREDQLYWKEKKMAESDFSVISAAVVEAEQQYQAEPILQVFSFVEWSYMKTILRLF